MALLVPNNGEGDMLSFIVNKSTPENLVLRLFTNNITPAETDTAATYTEASGSAVVSKTIVTASSGGIQTAGASIIGRTIITASNGGAQAGGTAAVKRTFSTASSGGITTDGNATIKRTFVVSSSGGAQTAGTATASMVSAGGAVYSVTSSGGVTTGGTATVTLISAPVVAPENTVGGFYAPPKKRQAFTHLGRLELQIFGWNDGEFVPSPENIEEEELLAAFLNG